MPKRNRTLAREIALQALFQQDLAGDDPQKISELLAEATEDSREREYARSLALGVLENRQDLDRRIVEVTNNWKLDRIAAVDRAILRLGLYELLEMDEVPPKVVINESVELAKKFSTAKSGSFVNGVLDRIYQDLSAKPGSSPGEEISRNSEAG
ncbi:MAG: transcription antitermination factor NusB [Planctomycetota bacterium]|nr:transcription antitermination factor NusB [Planctomycetota bacterium]|tara:strand:+ start:215 stop:676 length:462 start_codon:yes stop_codon:yes gene_type:complete